MMIVTDTYANAATRRVLTFVAASYPDPFEIATSSGAANRNPTPRIVVMYTGLGGIVLELLTKPSDVDVEGLG